MKILYISTVFPQINENSTIYTDLAEKLVERGHSVTVVATTYRRETRKPLIKNERGCKVLWIPVPPIYNVSLIRKGISILILPFLIKYRIKKYLITEAYDLILFESPPLTLESVVRYSKKLFNAKAFLMLKDIFPQNAIDIDIFSKNGIIYKYFRYKETQLYKTADRIGCMSNANLEYINFHNSVSVNKLCIFPNTKRVTHPAEIDKKYIRRKYNLPMNKTIFLFGGNMGKPQGIEFLTKAIKHTEKYAEAFFILVGRGTEKIFIEKELSKCNNVLLIENLPREQYEEVLSASDVGIISLDYRFTIPNFPSRILSYMDYSKPILGLVDPATDINQLIEASKCGYWCYSNSIEDFYSKVKLFSESIEEREIMGKNGRRYFEENLDVNKSVDILENQWRAMHDCYEEGE
ncbi:glycosyltransferase family 4 protein [Streptococcus suis]